MVNKTELPKGAELTTDVKKTSELPEAEENYQYETPAGPSRADYENNQVRQQRREQYKIDRAVAKADREAAAEEREDREIDIAFAAAVKRQNAEQDKREAEKKQKFEADQEAWNREQKYKFDQEKDEKKKEAKRQS